MSKLLKIEIENFKGVSQAVIVPLRTITLLFGANSAGKSTILQALHYARECLLNSNPDPDRTELGGSSIDLGGFRTLVNEHDTSKDIRIRIHLTAETSDLESYNAIALNNSSDEDNADFIEDEINIKTVWVEFKTGIQKEKVEITEYSVGINEEKIGTISKLFEKPVISEINFMHPLFRDDDNEMGLFLKERFAEDFLLPDNISMGKDPCLIVQSPIELIRQRSVVPTLKEELFLHTTSNRYEPEHETVIDEILSESESDSYTEEGDYSAFESLLSRLFVRPLELVILELQSIRYIAPIRDIVPRNFISPKTEDFARWANGFGAWDALMKDIEEHDDPDEMKLVNTTGEYLNEYLGLGYTLKAQKQYLLPSDHPILSELNLLVARFEERTPQHVRSKIVEPLSQLESEKRLKIVDQKNGVEVEPYDVGVGVSQVLPVVVGALEKGSKILAVEQPELHVHPAVACNLGDLFIREFVGQDRICLIETHSEHLVLRIMKRIRETLSKTLPPDIPAVGPEEVSIIFVENVDDRTVMRGMPLNERGELVKAWPGGFFEEALRETL